MLRQKILCAALAVPILLAGTTAYAVEIGGFMANDPDGADDDRATVADNMDEAIGTYSARMISAQAFQGQARTINAKVLVNTSAANTEPGTILLKLPRSIRYNFGLTLRVTGAELADAEVSAQALTFDAAAGTYGDAGGITACSAFPRDGGRVRLRTCGNAEDAATPVAINALRITALNITNAAGLGTPGHSISLTATLHDDGDNTVVHTSAPAVIYRSVDTASATVAAARAPLSVDPESTPPFTQLTGASTSGTLGSITILKRDTAMEVLDNAAEPTPLAASSVVEAAIVKATHPAFADDAFSSITATLAGTPEDTVAGTPAVPPTVLTVKKTSTTPNDPNVIKDGVATFNVPVANFSNPVAPPGRAYAIPIMINFDGRNRISSWGAGSASVEFDDAEAAGTQTYGLPNGAQGSLAAITRGGLNVHLNGVRNSYGNGADLYQSVIRVTNNGVVPGTIDVTVYDSADGDMVGEFTSGTISPGTMIQWTAAQIEGVLGHTPTDIVLYNIVLDGAITGYVQHLNWNAVDNLFSDLSQSDSKLLSGFSCNKTCGSSDGGDERPRIRRCDCFFPVLCQATAAPEPGEGALYHPSPGDDDKARDIGWAFYDLDCRAID